MKRKTLIIFILLFVAVLLAVGVIYGIPAYQEYQIHKAEEERRSQSAYYTDFKLSTGQLFVMLRFYGVKTMPETYLSNNPDDEEWPDYSYYEMEPTEYTEKVVVVLNHNLFVNPRTEDKLATKLATEYGFSIENHITVDWVMKNPVEAVDILHATSSLSYYSEFGNIVRDKYNEIMGIEDIEETNATESGAE